MAAEGYVIFEDTTWYQKHKEEIKEQIISLDTYVYHPMLIGTYLMKEGEYWLKGIESKPPLCRSEERRVGKECRSRWSPYH